MARAKPPVFISYAHLDQTLVLRVVEFLRGGGLNVFVDSQNIPYGADWRDTLAESIQRCERVMLFWTAAASLSKWVEREWKLALEQGKRVVPTLLDDTPLPPRLARLQAVTTLRGMFAAPARTREQVIAELAARDDLAAAAAEAPSFGCDAPAGQMADAVSSASHAFGDDRPRALASAPASTTASGPVPRRPLRLGALALSLAAAGVLGWFLIPDRPPAGSIDLPSTAASAGVPAPAEPASTPTLPSVPSVPAASDAPAPARPSAPVPAIEPEPAFEDALPIGATGLFGALGLLAAALWLYRWRRHARARRIVDEVLAA